MVSDEDSLLELLHELKAQDYSFTCVTPATHERFLLKRPGGEPTLRDIFGWNIGFQSDDIAPALLALLERSNCLETSQGKLRSLVRVASLGGQLFLHSSFPTTSPDAVFFGPDTYRFARFISERLSEVEQPRWILDMGAGSGAGGIVAAGAAPGARISLVDINPAAAALARVNARFAGVAAQIVISDALEQGPDLILANPPYMIDASRRTYRDGGDMLGGEISCRWAGQALQALAPGGTMLLYTGAAVVRGQAPLAQDIARMCADADAELRIEEIDPDVFGDELDTSDYREVERIAALGISIRIAR